MLLDGVKIRDMAMNRKERREVVKISDEGSGRSSPSKKRRKMQNGAQRDMSNAMAALERGEEQRVQILTAEAERDAQRIGI